MGDELRRNSRYVLENARITKVKALDRVTFLTAMCWAGKFPSYFDVCVFDKIPGDWQEGDAVTISGDLSMRKPKEGHGSWTLQLIARKISKGDDGLAPRPKRSRDSREDKPRDEQQDFGEVDF